MHRILVFLPLCVVLAIGCGGGGSGQDDYRVDVPQTRTWPASGIANLMVDTPNGLIAVSVTGADPISATITRSCKGTDKADAEAHIDDITVQDSITDGTLVLEADMPDPNDRSYSASFDFEAPVLEHVDLATSNGNITVLNHQGSTDATIANGEIFCDVAVMPGAGWAWLETTNGNVTLSVPANVAAWFDIQTVNGTAEVTGFGSVDYTTDEVAHKAGTLGAGGATLSITITNGNAVLQAR